MHPLVRLGVVVACSAGLLGCRPLSSHPLAVTAAAEARRNPRVAEALGTPVTCGTRVRGTANETDGIASLSFDVSGPKGRGVIAVDGKKTAGTWGVTHLELRPAAGGSDIPLTADIPTDTPKFDPSTAPVQPATPVAPPADVEISLPPVPPAG